MSKESCKSLRLKTSLWKVHLGIRKVEEEPELKCGARLKF